MELLLEGPVPLYYRGSARVVFLGMLLALYRERLLASVALPFGAVAMILTTIDLYGMISHSTACRTRECGSRVALSSSYTALLAVVLREVIEWTRYRCGNEAFRELCPRASEEAELYGIIAGDVGIDVSAVLVALLVGCAGFLMPLVSVFRISPL